MIHEPIPLEFFSVTLQQIPLKVGSRYQIVIDGGGELGTIFSEAGTDYTAAHEIFEKLRDGVIELCQ